MSYAQLAQQTLGIVCPMSFALVFIILFVAWVSSSGDLYFAKQEEKKLQSDYDREQKAYAKTVAELHTKIKSLEDKNASLDKHLENTSNLLNKANAKLAYIYDSVETTFRSDFGEMKNGVDNPG